MRFKIEYSKTKTDRWGHILPSQMFTEFADTQLDAEVKAVAISSKHKKYDVNVLDTEGPDVEGCTTWCVSGFRAGKEVFTNFDYLRASGLDVSLTNK